MDYSSIWKIADENDKERLSRQKEPENISKIINIPYIDDGSEFHKLDVYYPENTVSPMPVIIDIHGGGWVYGSKEINKIYCMNLSKNGFVVFNINYRLIPDCTFAQQMNDVSKALKWINLNLSQFPCDCKRIYLTGDSAGGQLAGYSAIINKNKELCELFSFEQSSIELNAIGLVSPNLYLTPFDFKNVYFRRLLGKDYRDLPFVNYLTVEALLEKASIPPSLFITSSGDYMALRQTLGAYESIKAKGYETELLNYGDVNGEKLPHVFSVLEPEKPVSIDAINKMLAFFRKH